MGSARADLIPGGGANFLKGAGGQLRAPPRASPRTCPRRPPGRAPPSPPPRRGGEKKKNQEISKNHHNTNNFLLKKKKERESGEARRPAPARRGCGAASGDTCPHKGPGECCCRRTPSGQRCPGMPQGAPRPSPRPHAQCHGRVASPGEAPARRCRHAPSAAEPERSWSGAGRGWDGTGGGHLPRSSRR